MQIMPFIWIGLAIVMAVCEAATAQLVSIWFVLGAICAAITTVFTPSIIIQTTVFLAVSFIALIVTKPLVKKLRNNGNAQNTNADRLIGMVGVVVTDIDDEQSIGQVKVAGETWSARSDFAPILKDNRIKVLAIEGVKLIVEPISKERK